MEIKIKETGEHKELNITWRQNGVNWAQDLIGNAGAMNDGQFVWSDDDDAYIASQDTFDWWAKYIADSEATNDEGRQLAESLGIDEEIVRERIEQNTGHDYGDHRKQAIRAMNELREEYAEA